MRPELLKFSGLRSYHGTAEIDFSDLGLFAIIGDTGSGKSTIIEALGLALYARPTWSGQIEGLVSDGATAWQVELSFAAGGRRWRVTRRRGRGASVDKLEELDGTGEKVDGKGAVNARVEEIIGLDHAQFTSAVVLPQGKFEKLLVAGETDRTKLLTSILGLDDIEATQRHAKQLLDEWNPKAETWAALRDRLGPDPAADAEVTAARAVETEARATALTKASQRCMELEPQVRDITAAHDALAGRLADLGNLADGFAADLTAAQQRWAQADQAADVADVELERIGEQAGQLDAARTQHLGGFATRDELVEALGTARRVAEQLPDRLAAVEQAREKLTGAQQDAPSGELDTDLITAIERTAGEVVAAEQRAREAEQAHQAGAATWQQLGERRARLDELQAQLPEATANLGSARDLVEAAQSELSVAEQVEKDAAVAARAALAASAADEAGAGCAPGDDCPVCARPLPADYTPPEHHPDVQAADAAEAAAREAVTQARARVAEHTRALERVASDVDRLRADIDTAEGAARDAAAAAATVGVDAGAADEKAALAGLASTVTATGEALDAARAAASDAVAARDAAKAELDRAEHEHKTRVAAATTELEHAERAVAELVADLDRLDVDAGEHADLGERAAGVLQKLDRSRATLEELDDQLRSLDADRTAATERRGTAADAARDARETARELLVHLRGRCDAVNQLHVAAAAATPDDTALPSVPSRPQVVSTASDLAEVVEGFGALVEGLDAVVAAAGQALEAAAQRRDTLGAELAELLAASGVGSVAELHGAAGAARAEAHEVGETLERHRQAASEAASYDERLATVRPFLANLRVLQEALRNNRFVAHLVAARETELLAEASRRLSEITGGRFGFGTGFRVINRHSGEQRRPEALSGGERFQAALALALGLMEIASRGTRGRLEAVFIDEGFGSLDGAALEQALDRLRSVSGDGTTVALVSHLRAVAEHVNDVLHVTRDDTTGSKVTKLDADQLERMLDDDARSGLTA